MMQTLWRDLRYALRMLEKSPVFTAVAVATLALGIGANTFIFQLLDAVRLRTLPVKNPEQIAKINIDHRNGASGSFTSRYADLTYAQWEQIRERQQAFSSVFSWGPNLLNISPGGEV
jgi:putative ABC transport system permease protein